MTKQISLQDLMLKMAELPEKVTKEVKKSMVKSAAKVRDDAKSKFGHLQPAVGNFPAWELLTVQTLHRKMDLGGAQSEDPLIGHYPSGGENHLWPSPLRNSIGSKVEGLSAAVGTDDPLGEWHEYGTDDGRIPPRPFLRPALYENQKEIMENVKDALVKAMKKF